MLHPHTHTHARGPEDKSADIVALLHVFGATDIATKGKETEYEALQEDCVGLTDDLNAMVIRAQAMTAPSLVQGAPY